MTTMHDVAGDRGAVMAPALTADRLLQGLLAAGLPIAGCSIGDVQDPSTWRFDGPLTDEDAKRAIQIVQDLLAPGPVVIVPSLDDVIEWAAKHVGQTLADAKAELAVIAEPVDPVPVDPKPVDPVPVTTVPVEG